MSRYCYLFRQEHIPARSAFPAIDAHNHMYVDHPPAKLVRIMDEVGLASYCNLSPGQIFSWVPGGVDAKEVELEDYFRNYAEAYPGRFYGFTVATLGRPTGKPLFHDAKRFVKETIELLGRHVSMGARGLKIFKSFGLSHKDSDGNIIAVDDPRLADIWDAAGELGVPVMIHQSDPYGFFQPCTPEIEHYDSLVKYSDWRFDDPEKFPRKEELLQRRDNLVRRHRNTTFILAHVANFPENLKYVSDLLDENPNAYIDISARIDELGRQPYSAREFFIKHQDRILFATDMPVSSEIYRCHFRFLETFDEYFIPPDYDGTFGRYRWNIYGIGLPKEVLAKVYYQNALKVIPGLRDDLRALLAKDDRLRQSEY